MSCLDINIYSAVSFVVVGRRRRRRRRQRCLRRRRRGRRQRKATFRFFWSLSQKSAFHPIIIEFSNFGF